MEKTSYAIGMNIGHNLLQSGAKNIDTEALARGISDVINGNKTDLEPQEAGRILNKYFAELEEAKSKEAIAEGKAFLEANATRPEVTTLKSGLQYEIMKAASGPTDTEFLFDEFVHLLG